MVFSKYYVCKQIEIRYSTESEWPEQLKRAFKNPHIVLPMRNNKNHDVNGINYDQIAVDNYWSDLESNSRKTMVNFIVSAFTLGRNKKIIETSSYYECILALQDSFRQLIHTNNTDLEVILATNEFSGIFRTNEAIITKYTNKFISELNIKYYTFYDMVRKEFKHSKHKSSRNRNLDTKTLMYKLLNLPISENYEINTLHFYNKSALNLYKFIYTLAKDSAEEKTSNLCPLKVNYLISNSIIRYGKLCTNKIITDEKEYFDSKLSRNFKRTIIQGHITPSKLFNIHSVLTELNQCNLMHVYELRVLYDLNLMSNMHDKSLFIDGNRIFNSFSECESSLSTDHQWLYKYLKELVPLTKYAIGADSDLDTKLSLTDPRQQLCTSLALKSDVEVQYFYFYIEPKLERLVEELCLRFNTETFKIKIATFPTEFSVAEPAFISSSPLTASLPIDADCTRSSRAGLPNFYSLLTKPNDSKYFDDWSLTELVSRPWIFYTLNNKFHTWDNFLEDNPLRHISTFTYLVKNILINYLYRHCLNQNRVKFNEAHTYSHPDWSEIDLDNANDFYNLLDNQFNSLSTETADKRDSLIILSLGSGLSEEDKNLMITKTVFDYDNVLITPNEWNLSLQTRNPLSVNNVLTKIGELDEFNISSFKHILNLPFNKSYHILYHNIYDDFENLIDNIEYMTSGPVNTNVVPLCLSKKVEDKAADLIKVLDTRGYRTTQPVGMGWVYDCYHYGLPNYQNSLYIHSGASQLNGTLWGWTFFIQNELNIGLDAEYLRKSWGISLEIIEKIADISLEITNYFIERLKQFGLDENYLEYLGGDNIYVKYTVISNDLTEYSNCINVNISQKNLVTFGEFKLNGIRICAKQPNESIEHVINTIISNRLNTEL